MVTENQEVIDFNVNDARILEVKEEFKDIDAYQDLDAAKAAKKTLTKMRTTLSDAHKEAKSDALAFGRKLDAEKNRLLADIKEIEDPISEDLSKIKNAATIAEANRVGAIEAELFRIDAIALDRHELGLEELKCRQERLREIPVTEEIFQEMLEAAQTHVQDVEMKLRIAVGQEEDRIKEAAAQAETAAENARKQKELDDRQAKMDAEDAERQAIRDKEDAARREKEAEENAEKEAEFKRIAAEQEAEREQLDKERREREAAAAEEERKNLAAEEEARRAEQAPDRVKLLLFSDRVDELLKTKPTLATDAASDIMLQAAAMLIEVAYDIRKMTEEMK